MPLWFLWLGIYLAQPCSAAFRPLEDNPGWLIDDTNQIGISVDGLDGSPESVWLLLKPPDNRSALPIGQNLVNKVILEKMSAEEAYQWALDYQRVIQERKEQPGRPSRPTPSQFKLPESPQWVFSRMLGIDPEYSAPKCQRIAKGQSVIVDEPLGATSPTSVAAQYLLSRPENGLYVARLRLRYEIGEGYDLKLTASDLDRHFHEKTSRCLAAYASALRNPETQDLLHIELSEDPAIPLRAIAIREAHRRADSLNYNSDIGCTTILHEVLHLLGLADEYVETKGMDYHFRLEMRDEKSGDTKERKETVSIKANCRAIGPEDSIMRWNDLAVRKAVPLQKIAVKRCLCAPGENCLLLAKKSDGLNCPEGSVLMEAMQASLAGEEIKAHNDSRSFLLSGAKHEVIWEEESEGKELLYPAHFRVITEPGCADVNALYYACAQNSHRFEPLPKVLEEAGAKTAPRFGCRPMPEACQNGKTGWLSAKPAAVLVKAVAIPDDCAANKSLFFRNGVFGKYSEATKMGCQFELKDMGPMQSVYQIDLCDSSIHIEESKLLPNLVFSKLNATDANCAGKSDENTGFALARKRILDFWQEASYSQPGNQDGDAHKISCVNKALRAYLEHCQAILAKPAERH